MLGTSTTALAILTKDGQYCQLYALAGGSSHTHPLVDLCFVLKISLPALALALGRGVLGLLWRLDWSAKGSIMVMLRPVLAPLNKLALEVQRQGLGFRFVHAHGTLDRV